MSQSGPGGVTRITFGGAAGCEVVRNVRALQRDPDKAIASVGKVLCWYV